MKVHIVEVFIHRWILNYSPGILNFAISSKYLAGYQIERKGPARESAFVDNYNLFATCLFTNAYSPQ
jgi:hypothetical protein